MKNKKIVLRMCALTRERLEKKDLFRIVKNKENNIFIDETYKANGRGCYLKKDKNVLISAKNKKILNRIFEMDIDDSIYDELIKKL